jgi:shikimate kinase
MMRHIVLVGLPGAGKSVIGAHAADLMRAGCTDIDAALVRRLQMPMVNIFGELGEPRFRELEREAVAAAMAEPPGVLVPGGGWAAQPGALESVRPGAFIIYVKALPSDAAEWASQGELRPLLTGASPLDRMEALLAEREPFYLQADAEVFNHRQTVESAAAEVVRLARTHAGW